MLQRAAPREFIPIRLPWGRSMEPSPCPRETACYQAEFCLVKNAVANASVVGS